jgi:hypothetical protein
VGISDAEDMVICGWWKWGVIEGVVMLWYSVSMWWSEVRMGWVGEGDDVIVA